jgi:hypothetical protein
MARPDRRCQRCGATLPEGAAGPAAPAAEAPQRSEAIAEFDLVPRYRDAPLPPGPTWPGANVRRSDQGETLAVLALLLPLIAQGLSLACHFDPAGVAVALSWGAVVVTALVLAVDAALLGAVDLQGTRRSGPAALFFGVLLLWIICYPMAFFRRRHFGRPNLGPLAVLVAGFFVAAPWLHNYARFGVAGDGVPTCTSREVIGMVDDMVRQGPVGPSVQSIGGHRETSYDPVSQTRKGECLVKTPAETLTVTYRVKMLNRANGTYQVEVGPILPEGPPPCTDAEVVALVERLIREGPNGHLLQAVAGHEEVRYDRERKVRHGRCRVTLQGRAADVAYKVYWLDRRTGQFQVEFEP